MSAKRSVTRRDQVRTGTQRDEFEVRMMESAKNLLAALEGELFCWDVTLGTERVQKERLGTRTVTRQIVLNKLDGKARFHIRTQIEDSLLGRTRRATYYEEIGFGSTHYDTAKVSAAGYMIGLDDVASALAIVTAKVPTSSAA